LRRACDGVDLETSIRWAARDDGVCGWEGEEKEEKEQGEEREEEEEVKRRLHGRMRSYFPGG
jgi:hypothetical protein